MKWKQFFTPVSSINSDEVRRLAVDSGEPAPVFLDVRQPGEYKSSHLPGAKLIPLGELDRRLGELDPERPTVVY